MQLLLEFILEICHLDKDVVSEKSILAMKAMVSGCPHNMAMCSALVAMALADSGGGMVFLL